MKVLKIVLIIVLLVVMCSISFGTGSITSGDKTVDMADIKEMYGSNETISLGVVNYKESGNYIAELEEEVERLRNKIVDLEELGELSAFGSLEAYDTLETQCQYMDSDIAFWYSEEHGHHHNN